MEKRKIGVLFFKRIFFSLFVLLTIHSSLSAAVFDYRFYYAGTSQDTNKDKLSYSISIYSYFLDNDFSFGGQEMLSETKDSYNSKINSASLLLGYDINSIFHIEGAAGASTLFREGKYYKGSHYGGTILVQSNFDSFLEAIQLGLTYSYDDFKNSNIENEREIKVFIGFGF